MRVIEEIEPEDAQQGTTPSGRASHAVHEQHQHHGERDDAALHPERQVERVKITIPVGPEAVSQQQE